MKEAGDQENKKRGIIISDILKEINDMFTDQQNIEKLIKDVDEEKQIYYDHIKKIPDQESIYAKEENTNYKNFEDELKGIKEKCEEERNRLESLKINAEQTSVDINLDELRKMQKDHDNELDEIDTLLKEVGESVAKLATASGKKNLVREINNEIGKIKGLTSKARGKQTHLGGKVDEC